MIKRIVIALVMVLSLVMLTNAAFSATPAKVVTKAPAVSKAVEVPAPAVETGWAEKIFTMEFVQNLIQVFLMTVVLPGVTFLGLKIYELIQNSTKNIKSDLGRKAATKTLEVLKGIVERTAAIERKKLEAKFSDGRLTKDEFKELLKGLGTDALDEAKRTVGFSNFEQAKAEYNDFESHMKNELEKYVESKKQQSPIILSATPPAGSEPATPSTGKAA